MARRPERAEAPKKTAPKKRAPSFATNESRARALRAIAERHAFWRPASEVLVHVRAVPTVFPWLDMVTRVGGWPVERVTVVHGPSNEGKTALVLGLGLSFLLRGHLFALIDAEQTTPWDWVQKLMGPEVDNPAFFASRPTTYEETVDGVARLCNDVAAAKARGDLPPDATGLIAVDSIRKLSPKNLLDRLFKDGPDGGASGEKKGMRGQKQAVGVDGYNGRAAQYKAALNTQWMDSLVPLLAKSGLGVVIIARETDKDASDFFDSASFKVGGGVGINYDASLRVRVTLDGDVTHGEKSDKVYYGQRHAVEVLKTKIGQKDERYPTAYFHTSNGKLSAEGFDRARDVLELAGLLKLVEQSGSWYSYADRKLGQGEHAAVHGLASDPELLGRLEAACRAAYASESPVRR